MENIIIRKARLEDAAGIANVQQKGWILAHVNKAYNITKKDIETHLGSIQTITKNFTKYLMNKTPYYVAEDSDSRILGYVGTHKDGNDWSGGIYIHPDSVGKGIGTRLLTSLFKEFENSGIYFCVGIAIYNTASIAIFKKFEFSDTGERKSYKLKLGNKSIPLLFMKRQF